MQSAVLDASVVVKVVRLPMFNLALLLKLKQGSNLTCSPMYRCAAECMNGTE